MSGGKQGGGGDERKGDALAARSTLPEYGGSAPPERATPAGATELQIRPTPVAAVHARQAAPLRVPADPTASGLPQPGEVIAERYRIERELGRGAMGVVYAVTQLGSERGLALKWLFEVGGPRQAERRRRFLREARAASAISHPNVVKVYDAGEHAGGVFLVMERLDGPSLREHMKHGPLRVADAIDLLMPALRGLDAVHQHGIVHRDLKPENLLVCEQTRVGGARTELKVVDFGLSKLMGNASDSLATTPGAMIGTPQYMAPEQAGGRPDVDARADVYAIGVLLYELVAGRRPLEAATLAALLLKLAREKPQPLHAVVNDVPLGFSKAVMRALERDPVRRYASVAQLARAIEPFGRVAFASHVLAAESRLRALWPLRSLSRALGSRAGDGEASGASVHDSDASQLSAQLARAARMRVRMALAAFAVVLIGALGWAMSGSERRTGAADVVNASAVPQPQRAEPSAALALELAPSAQAAAPATAAAQSAAVASDETATTGRADAAGDASPRDPSAPAALRPQRGRKTTPTRPRSRDAVQPLRGTGGAPAPATQPKKRLPAGIVDPWE